MLFLVMRSNDMYSATTAAYKRSTRREQPDSDLLILLFDNRIGLVTSCLCCFGLLLPVANPTGIYN